MRGSHTLPSSPPASPPSHRPPTPSRCSTERSDPSPDDLSSSAPTDHPPLPPQTLSQTSETSRGQPSSSYPHSIKPPPPPSLRSLTPNSNFRSPDASSHNDSPSAMRRLHASPSDSQSRSERSKLRRSAPSNPSPTHRPPLRDHSQSQPSTTSPRKKSVCSSSSSERHRSSLSEAAEESEEVRTPRVKSSRRARSAHRTSTVHKHYKPLATEIRAFRSIYGLNKPIGTCDIFLGEEVSHMRRKSDIHFGGAGAAKFQLDFARFSMLVRKQRGEGCPEQWLLKQFEGMDKECCGRILMDDFLSFILCYELLHSWQPFASLFEAWDTDASGKVSRDEFVSFLSRTNLLFAPEPDEILRLFKLIDSNDKGKLSYEEMHASLRALLGPDAPEEGKRIKQGAQGTRDDAAARPELSTILEQPEGEESETQKLWHKLVANRARVLDIFRQQDVNKINHISRVHFRNGLILIGFFPTRKQLDSVLKMFDTGAGGFILISELQRALRFSARQDRTPVAGVLDGARKRPGPRRPPADDCTRSRFALLDDSSLKEVDVTPRSFERASIMHSNQSTLVSRSVKVPTTTRLPHGADVRARFLTGMRACQLHLEMERLGGNVNEIHQRLLSLPGLNCSPPPCEGAPQPEMAPLLSPRPHTARGGLTHTRQPVVHHSTRTARGRVWLGTGQPTESRNNFPLVWEQCGWLGAGESHKPSQHSPPLRSLLDLGMKAMPRHIASGGKSVPRMEPKHDIPWASKPSSRRQPKEETKMRSSSDSFVAKSVGLAKVDESISDLLCKRHVNEKSHTSP